MGIFSGSIGWHDFRSQAEVIPFEVLRLKSRLLASSLIGLSLGGSERWGFGGMSN